MATKKSGDQLNLIKQELQDQHLSDEDEHDVTSTPTKPSQVRKELSTRLLANNLNLIPSDGKHVTSITPSPLLSTSKARATSGFFAKSTLDPACGEKIRPSLILGLLYFKNHLSADKCREILTQRLVLEFQRFRSKVVLKNGEIFFQELPLADIDMDYHVQEVASRGWTQADMDSFLSAQYQISKSSHAPLWVFYVMNDLADGRSCLVGNIDHCIGDGITMVQVGRSQKGMSVLCIMSTARDTCYLFNSNSNTTFRY
jgi:hypothetical protein